MKPQWKMRVDLNLMRSVISARIFFKFLIFLILRLFQSALLLNLKSFCMWYSSAWGHHWEASFLADFHEICSDLPKILVLRYSLCQKFQWTPTFHVPKVLLIFSILVVPNSVIYTFLNIPFTKWLAPEQTRSKSSDALDRFRLHESLLLEWSRAREPISSRVVPCCAPSTALWGNRALFEHRCSRSAHVSHSTKIVTGLRPNVWFFSGKEKSRWERISLTRDRIRRDQDHTKRQRLVSSVIRDDRSIGFFFLQKFDGILYSTNPLKITASAAATAAEWGGSPPLNAAGSWDSSRTASTSSTAAATAPDASTSSTTAPAASSSVPCRFARSILFDYVVQTHLHFVDHFDASRGRRFLKTGCSTRLITLERTCSGLKNKKWILSDGNHWEMTQIWPTSWKNNTDKLTLPSDPQEQDTRI